MYVCVSLHVCGLMVILHPIVHEHVHVKVCIHFTFVTCFLQASCQLLNGVNLLVCTPPSLLRLHANNTAAFSHIRYLVSL